MATDEGLENGEEAKVGILKRMLSPILRFRERPLHNSLVLGGVSALFIGGYLLFSLGDSDEEQKKRETIEYALAKLDEGEFAEARMAANLVAQKENASYDDSGGPLFVLGSILFHDAMENPNADQRSRLFLLAARYLEQAHLTGFPSGREGIGEFKLGRALYETGDFAKCVEPLQRSINRDYPDKGEVHRLVALAMLRAKPAKPVKALDAVRKHLASPDLSTRQSERGRLLQAKIHLVMGDLEKCQQVLKRIPDESTNRARRSVTEARVFLAKTDKLLQGDVSDQVRIKAMKEYARALKLLETEEAYAESDREALGQLAYLNGILKKRLGKASSAESQFLLARGRHFGTPEGFACAIQAARVQLENAKFAPAVESFTSALREIKSPALYQNEWISLDELHRIVIQGHQALVDNGQHELAVQLVDQMSPALETNDVLGLRAQTHEAWGKSLEEFSKGQSPKRRTELTRLARTQWKEAGRAYYELAQALQTSPKYAEHLWASAMSFRNGQNYTVCERILQEYMDNETRRRQPRALVAIGEAKLCTNQPADALHFLNQCITYHQKHPDSYRARILASHAYIDLGEMEKAQSMLEDNLNSTLTPASADWRQSLFLLGRLFFHRATEIEAQSRKEGVHSPVLANRTKGLATLTTAKPHFEDAISRLGDFVEFNNRYESDTESPTLLESRYWIAESHRLVARVPAGQLPFETIATTRNQLRADMSRHLREAATAYDELRKQLNGRLDQRELDAVEDAVLRNCYFLRGDVFFDLGDYSKAFDEYSTATNRFPHHPSSLEAFMQMAHCQRRMGKIADARGTLERAKVVLQHIKDEDFALTTRYDRQEWTNIIDWFLQL